MVFGLFGKEAKSTGAGKPQARAGSAAVAKRPAGARPQSAPPAPAPAPPAKRQREPSPPPPPQVDFDEEESEVQVAPRAVALMPRSRALVGEGAPRSAALPVQHSTFRQPTTSDVERFLAYAGKVVSSDLPQAKQRLYLAALEDGTVLVAKSDANSAAVTSARQMLARSGFVAKGTFLVDLEVIRKVNEAYAKRAGTSVTGRRGDHDTAAMQKTVTELIRIAAEMRCSDIHITVAQHEAKVRVRTDGVIMDLRELPSGTALDLCQAAFNMADASDASYKPYEYQGARITAVKQPLPSGVQAVRLQFNPLPDGGRYAILRLLYSQKVGSDSDVDQLGYSQHQIAQIRRMREKPFGINIISGPTGSGKSTTLQRSLTATLREKRNEVNVITVEDPPEYEITGAAQLPVTNVKTDEERREAFRAAIAASLRSDPDIVMIGEIRDGASASLAFQAAMTGHQVWASLHANDAVSILGRLRDVQVETYKLSDPTLVTGLIGQRLIRRLCDKCKLGWKEGVDLGLVDDKEAGIILEALGGTKSLLGRVHFARPEGCPGCGNRGYSGRTVVAETILPDRTFMEHIAAEQKSLAVEHWLESLDGMTMLEHAIMKMLGGECDPRDVKDKVGVFYEADPKRVAKFAAELV